MVWDNNRGRGVLGREDGGCMSRQQNFMSENGSFDAETAQAHCKDKWASIVAVANSIASIDLRL